MDSPHTPGYRLPQFHRISAPSNFYFLRHGESEGNRSGIVQGRSEFRLSEKGEGHARSAGEWMRRKRIDTVYSSPLIRSFRTAEIIAETAGLAPPVSDPLLTELGTGTFTGRSFTSIETDSPEHYRRFRESSWEDVENAETIADISERAYRLWEMLIDTAESGKRSILSVTHSGFLQWILKTSMGGASRWMPIFSIGNCGIFYLFVSPPHSDQTVQRVREDSFYAQWRLINHLPYEH